MLIAKESVLPNSLNKYYAKIVKQLDFKKFPQLSNLKGTTSYYHNHAST